MLSVGVTWRAAMVAHVVALFHRYTVPVRMLHWVTGTGMIVCVGTVLAAQQCEKGDPNKGKLMHLHKSTALITAAAAAVRLVVVVVSRAPAPIPGSPIMHLLARLGHLALYGFTVVMPVSGIIMGCVWRVVSCRACGLCAREHGVTLVSLDESGTTAARVCHSSLCTSLARPRTASPAMAPQPSKRMSPLPSLQRSRKTTDERWVLRFLRFQIHKFAGYWGKFLIPFHIGATGYVVCSSPCAVYGSARLWLSQLMQVFRSVHMAMGHNILRRILW